MIKTLLPAPAAASLDGFWSDWLQRSGQAKADQPHWMTPLATVTPRLELGPMHRPGRDEFSRKVVHRETL
jgi:hypothetical protein